MVAASCPLLVVFPLGFLTAREFFPLILRRKVRGNSRGGRGTEREERRHATSIRPLARQRASSEIAIREKNVIARFDAFPRVSRISVSMLEKETTSYVPFVPLLSKRANFSHYDYPTLNRFTFEKQPDPRYCNIFFREESDPHRWKRRGGLARTKIEIVQIQETIFFYDIRETRMHSWKGGRVRVKS